MPCAFLCTLSRWPAPANRTIEYDHRFNGARCAGGCCIQDERWIMDFIRNWRRFYDTQNVCSSWSCGMEEFATGWLFNMAWNCTYRSQTHIIRLRLLTWYLQIFYTAQTSLAFSVGNYADGLANNSMTAAQRSALSPSDPEYHARYLYPTNQRRHT